MTVGGKALHTSVPPKYPQVSKSFGLFTVSPENVSRDNEGRDTWRHKTIKSGGGVPLSLFSSSHFESDLNVWVAHFLPRRSFSLISLFPAEQQFSYRVFFIKPPI